MGITSHLQAPSPPSVEQTLGVTSKGLYHHPWLCHSDLFRDSRHMGSGRLEHGITLLKRTDSSEPVFKRGHLFYKWRKEKLWMRKYVAPGTIVRDLATSLRRRSHPEEAGLKESQRKQATTLMTASGWKTNQPHPHPWHLITLWETTNSLVV